MNDVSARVECQQERPENNLPAFCPSEISEIRVP
jgi:hypothetical protein